MNLKRIAEAHAAVSEKGAAGADDDIPDIGLGWATMFNSGMSRAVPCPKKARAQYSRK